MSKTDEQENTDKLAEGAILSGLAAGAVVLGGFLIRRIPAVAAFSFLAGVVAYASSKSGAPNIPGFTDNQKTTDKG